MPAFLTDPTVAYLLLSFGLLGIFLEVSHPGATLPGVLGVTSGALGLLGLSQLDVNWLAVGLLAVAFLLFVLDIYLPSIGLLTVLGLVSFVAGSRMLVDDVGGVAPAAIWAMTISLALFFAAIGLLGTRSFGKRPVTGREAMVGRIAVVREALDPVGAVWVLGERWQAELMAPEPGAAAQPGSEVRIERVQGLTLVVSPVSSG